MSYPKKYAKEQEEALRAIESGELPVRIWTKSPLRSVMRSVYKYIRRRGIMDTELSSDANSFWIRKI